MAVNRMWGHFFGTGFVDPIDDFGDQQPASHPELLDALAVEFAAQDYDLKFLMRAITQSRAYNLSSRQTDPSQADARQFARMAVKGLSAAQVYDSLVRATGRFEPFALQNPFIFGQRGSPRQRIGELFADQGTTPMERPTTILQSLALMNGEFVTQEDQSVREQAAALSRRVSRLYDAGPHRRDLHGGADAPADVTGTRKVCRICRERRPDRRCRPGAVRRLVGAAERQRIPLQPLTSGACAAELGSPTMRFTRRDWLRLSVMGLTGHSLSGWLPSLAADASAPTGRARSVILLWMPGGPSQTDTFDMQPGHANGGEFRPIDTSVPGIQVCEHLPQLAQQMQHVAVVPSMQTKEGDHLRATYHLHTGYRPQPPVQYPTMGSLLSHELVDDHLDLPGFRQHYAESVLQPGTRRRLPGSVARSSGRGR